MPSSTIESNSFQSIASLMDFVLLGPIHWSNTSWSVKCHFNMFKTFFWSIFFLNFFIFINSKLHKNSAQSTKHTRRWGRRSSSKRNTLPSAFAKMFIYSAGCVQSVDERKTRKVHKNLHWICSCGKFQFIHIEVI